MSDTKPKRRQSSGFTDTPMFVITDPSDEADLAFYDEEPRDRYGKWVGGADLGTALAAAPHGSEFSPTETATYTKNGEQWSGPDGVKSVQDLLDRWHGGTVSTPAHLKARRAMQAKNASAEPEDESPRQWRGIDPGDFFGMKADAGQFLSLSNTPGGREGDSSPLAKPGYMGGRKLTDQEREIAHALIRKGHTVRDAIRMARGLVNDASHGKWGRGKVRDPKVSAAARASVAERKTF